jgi:hypothetical protein
MQCYHTEFQYSPTETSAADCRMNKGIKTPGKYDMLSPKKNSEV